MCRKVYIGETGRCIHEQIEEHNRGIQLSQTKTSAIYEHAKKVMHYQLWD